MAEGGAELTSQAPYVLAEYQSLDGILAPIRNLTRVKYACFDASKRYLAFGATTGDVFMFHRDTTAYITTITNKEGAVSQVALAPDDFVLGIATSRGHVVVLEHNARRPTVQAQRLQLSFEHKGSVVTCLEWNSAGTRLFVADNTGKVSVLNVSTSKAKSLFQSPPSTLMRLDSKVVQLNFAQDRLLASTLTRCYLGDTIREKFTQVGKKLRDGEFGGCFYPGSKPQDSMCIYAARPGSRIWQADLKGSVLKTHQFKEALAINSVKLVTYRSDTSTLGSAASPPASTTAFTKLLTIWASNHSSPFLISWSSNGLYVINPQEGEIVLWNDELKDVKDLRCVRNNIYIQLHSGEFCTCSLLTPVQAVLCFLQHSHAMLCGQFLCQNQLLIPKPAFEKTVPSELCFDLYDKLQEAGQISLAASVAKILLDNYDVDITKKPAKPKADLTKEDSLDSSSSNPAHVSVERAPTKRRSREAQKSRDEWGVSSPRHVRCHSSEPIKTHVVYSPRPARKTVRRGSDPAPPSTIEKTLPAESSLKVKPTKACSPTPAQRSIGPSSTQRERSLSLDAPRQGAHESQPARTLSERPRQLPTASKSPALVGLSVGSRDQNKVPTKVNSDGSSGRETPEDAEVSPTPGCSEVERGNNRKAYGSALRILPAIPASPLDSPMSPLDRVDPEVLASMYAEQDVGYESVYQYLSLGVYGSSLVPAAFTMRGADLAQLANVADLTKLRDTLSSRISNGKDTILKNLRGLESKLKYFSVDQVADVGLTSPLSVVPECTPADPNLKPGEKFSKHLTPKDEFWSFLPSVNSSFIEATLRASASANDPSIFYHGPSLVMVLEEWLEALHSTQISIVNQIASTETAKLPAVISHCDSVQKSPDETFSSPSSHCDTKISEQLNLIKSIFTSDPFRLPSEVAEKAKELAMLCFQTRTLGTVERVAAKVSEVEGREKLASSMYNGSSAATDVKLSKHGSTNSLCSEDASTHCDLSLSMRSSASEKYGFHLSDMPTVDSCSESAMFQSMSSSCGGLSINLDFRPEESVQQPSAPSVRKTSFSQCRQETNGDRAEGANQQRGSEELATVPSASPSHSPLTENESVGAHKAIAVPTEGSSVLKDECLNAVSMNGFALHQGANSCESVAGEGFTGQRNLSVYSDLSPSQGSQSEATSVSWMPMIPQSKEKAELFRNHVNDAKTALFIRYYFHLLDLEVLWDVVQLTESPCFETWSTVVLGVLQELKGRHRNEGGPEHLVIIAQQMQNMAGRPWLLLAYFMLLHEVAQDKAADTFAKKASSLSARDILYFTQLCKVESLFLGAMQGALSCFTLPQMLSSLRKYLENEEVRWEWVTQCLQSVNNECLKCSCGAPSYNSHKSNWPMYEHLKAVLCNKDWISQKSLELCRTYAFWPGYLCALKHLGHRTEHLVNVIQLGDAELLMPDNFLGFVPESPQEWKLAMELVGRHRTERVVVTCLSCGKPQKSTETQTPLTLQSVAQRMLVSLGFEQAAAILHDLNLPRNSLGQGFYLASVLLTLIEQQQAALSHRMLSRLESYVWSRRPVTLPPQVADVLDREKQGLAGHDDLTDVQLQGSFVEEPESHWGGNIPLLSNCLLCGLPLGTTVDAHAVVMCHCGHCFHESCLPSPGDFCVICSEEEIWKR
ncbi:WD40 repeat domain-containing protein pink [Rhipicephalus microplus]|uniref:WD40 repeat domain-containing protein pink n=1 Tax=Rhipicephalus microplus TaxID=6941 RepID=UPI003F6A6F7A